MVVPAVVLRSRLVLRLLAGTLAMVDKHPVPGALRQERPQPLRGAASARMVPDDEEPTWEDAEWQ